jgi:hypothetical protein
MQDGWKEASLDVQVGTHRKMPSPLNYLLLFQDEHNSSKRHYEQ